jgi:voltage-gated potassium channel
VQRKIIIALFIILLALAFGTVGYQVLLGWSWYDALYMTLITITTIGYKEVYPLNAEGRALTMLLIFFGVFGVLYAFTVMGQFIIEGQMRDLFRRKRMEKKAGSLSNHVIVCGFGRMGRIIAEELRSRKVPFVIIEKQPEIVRQIIDSGMNVIEGDATSDETLRTAGVERARAMVAVVESDAENLYLTLSARVLNKDCFILSRCSDDAAEEKLYRAGASKVISPYRIGARQMAEFIVRPNIMRFIEMAFEKGNIHLEIQELAVPPNSQLDGVTLLNSGLRQNYNVIVVGIRKKQSDTMVFNPPVDSNICSDDILILLGEPERMDRLLADIGRT